MTLHPLGGNLPVACQPKAVVVIVPHPIPRHLPLQSRPFRDRLRSATLLLAAPENTYYRPVSFESLNGYPKKFSFFFLDNIFLFFWINIVGGGSPSPLVVDVLCWTNFLAFASVANGKQGKQIVCGKEQWKWQGKEASQYQNHVIPSTCDDRRMVASSQLTRLKTRIILLFPNNHLLIRFVLWHCQCGETNHPRIEQNRIRNENAATARKSILTVGRRGTRPG